MHSTVTAFLKINIDLFCVGPGSRGLAWSSWSQHRLHFLRLRHLTSKVVSLASFCDLFTFMSSHFGTFYSTAHLSGLFGLLWIGCLWTGRLFLGLPFFGWLLQALPIFSHSSSISCFYSIIVILDARLNVCWSCYFHDSIYARFALCDARYHTRYASAYFVSGRRDYCNALATNLTREACWRSG